MPGRQIGPLSHPAGHNTAVVAVVVVVVAIIVIVVVVVVSVVQSHWAGG